MRRLALFGATVLFPSALLVVFGSRMIRQDNELAVRHTEDLQRARAVEQRQRRLAALERLKRTATEDFFAGRKLSIDFAALVVENEIRLSWEQADVVHPATDSCERAEFTVGRLSEAIACYRRCPDRNRAARADSTEREAIDYFRNKCDPETGLPLQIDALLNCRR